MKRIPVSENDRKNGRLAILTASKCHRPEMIEMAGELAVVGSELLDKEPSRRVYGGTPGTAT